MISIEMFREEQWFYPLEFLQNFSPRRGGGDRDKRKLRIAAAADSRGVHITFFLPKYVF